MNKSDIYKAIIKIKKHCKEEYCCESCVFFDELDGDECLLAGYPSGWNTDDLQYDVLEGETGD